MGKPFLSEVWANQFGEREALRRKEFAKEHINVGFELLLTANTGEDLFGKILCIEFFEVYSSLCFGIFFGSSVLYQGLRVSDATTPPAEQVRCISYVSCGKLSNPCFGEVVIVTYFLDHHRNDGRPCPFDYLP